MTKVQIDSGLLPAALKDKLVEKDGENIYISDAAPVEEVFSAAKIDLMIVEADENIAQNTKNIATWTKRKEWYAFFKAQLAA